MNISHSFNFKRPREGAITIPITSKKYNKIVIIKLLNQKKEEEVKLFFHLLLFFSIKNYDLCLLSLPLLLLSFSSSSSSSPNYY
jgi:hypothetical protein